MKNKYRLFLLVILVPIVINYGLLSWRAPGVKGDGSAWLGFFANYLGIVSAVLITLYQQRKQREKDNEDEINQKKKDDEKDRQDNRSYIVLHDFYSNVRLKNVKTHENSRIIETEGYKYLLETMKKVWNIEDYSTSFLKLSHFGNPDVILDCNVKLTVKFELGIEKIEVNIGAFEKGIEIFIPVVPVGAYMGEIVELEEARVEYSTLRNERIHYIHELENKRDVCKIVWEDGQEEVLYEFSLNESQWIYPNKIESKDKGRYQIKQLKI